MKKKNYKIRLWSYLLLLIVTTGFSQKPDEVFESKFTASELKEAPVKLIPHPQEVNWMEGRITVDKINIDDINILDEFSIQLIKEIFNTEHPSGDEHDYTLQFIQDNEIDEEGYILKVDKEALVIRFRDEPGRFYALQTLRQLSFQENGYTSIQLCEIKDAPLHGIRGFMLDVGRNFISVDILKAQLEIMARYKLNVFQWHLTDRPAWRIQSKIYPELTKPENHRPTRNPGKFYTYDEIRELIQYARKMHITVIPEIDMPGHSDSFTKAMGFTMASEEGMMALERILNEFFEEIPKELAPMIHLGSDEVEIENPEAFMNKMVSLCQDHQRDVIVWNPGLKVSDNVIRQTWKPGDLKDEGYREIDSWNSYINNTEPMTAVPKLLFKPIGYKSNNKVLGGILSLWPDVRLENQNDFIDQNPLYPALLTYAWATWTGDITKTSDQYLTILPRKGTEAFHYLQAFEDYLIHHKQRYFESKPFQYVQQTNNEWLLSHPLAEDEAKILEAQLINRHTLDTSDWKKAVGNTIIIKDRFKQGGYFPEASKGTTVYAISKIKADKDKVLQAWIGFETPLRANRTYTGIPKTGEWDANGGTVWVNGKKIPAPKWKNPGWKPSKQNGWATKEDQEIPWTQEELYWTRKPVNVTLQKGINTIVFKIPSATEYQNWMFTFAPLETHKLFSEHYYQRKALFESQLDTQNEIIFLGNSITEGGNWKNLFPGKNAVNRGISGDVTDGILARLEEVVSSQPSKIFLLVGTNDLARGKDINYVLDHTIRIIEVIKRKSPDTEIFLQSILPVNPNVGEKFSGHKSNHQKIMETNARLEELTEKLNVEFIDLHKAMSNKNKYLKSKYTHDGLHLSEKGYLKWKKILKKANYIN